MSYELILMDNGSGENMKKLIKIFGVGIIVTIIALVGDRFLSQRKIDQLETQNITRISTRYFDDVVEIKKSDPNFQKVIELTSKIKLERRHRFFVIYGMPITVTFYDRDDVVVELSPNYNLMDVDNKMYHTKLSSFDELETLRSLLGVYYGFDQ